MKVRREHVTRNNRLRLIFGIRHAAASELVSASGRQLEVGITVTKPGKIGGQVEQLLRDKMDDLPLPLRNCFA